LNIFISPILKTYQFLPKYKYRYIRTTCKHQDEPIAELCRAYNRETKDGYKMDKYSKLLDKSIESIVDVKEANDLDTLFNSGSDVLFNSGISGIDDFELITFIVIK